MRKRVALAVAALTTTALLLAAQSAAAATTVGNTCLGNQLEPELTAVGLSNDPSVGLPSAVPANGVITSWTFSIISGVPAGLFSEQLKVFRPTGVPKQLLVVGESTLSPVGSGANTFSTRIPVHAGDLIGASGLVQSEGKAVAISIFCKEAPAGDRMGFIAGSPANGSTATLGVEAANLQSPVTVKVEPDADGDGYGDETQDLCPTNAAVQGPCPVPPAPITLSATSAAKKGLVTVTLTASAQASVTVAGTVKVGGSKVKLSGGTQVVAPGTLAKFTVLFPSKLKKKLKQTPTSQKLTLELSASAPGATTSAFKVKVKGQKKPQKHTNG